MNQKKWSTVLVNGLILLTAVISLITAIIELIKKTL